MKKCCRLLVQLNVYFGAQQSSIAPTFFSIVLHNCDSTSIFIEFRQNYFHDMSFTISSLGYNSPNWMIQIESEIFLTMPDLCFCLDRFNCCLPSVPCHSISTNVLSLRRTQLSSAFFCHETENHLAVMRF